MRLTRVIHAQGFALANGTVASTLAILGSDPARAARFGRAMSIYATKPEYAPSYLTEYYDWGGLVPVAPPQGGDGGSQQQQAPVRVLAIGGGSYLHVVVELVRRFANLDVTVSDTAATLPALPDRDAAVPADVRGRLHLAAVDDLFAPQQPPPDPDSDSGSEPPVDVVLLRWVLHIWPDKYCVRLLRAQIPLLRPGARLVIQDAIMPEPGAVPLWREQDLR